MVSSKSRADQSEASNGKPVSATSKFTKPINWNKSPKTDYSSTSPVHKSSSSSLPKLSVLVAKPRSLVERTSKYAESKLSHKSSATPETLKQTPKNSEEQLKPDAHEDELKNAMEKLASVEQEKLQIAEELNESKRLADEANEKLQEAICGKENAEKSLEIEKLRADKLERESVEGANEKEAALREELDIIRKQHALDVSALHSATEELQKLKVELANAVDAKNAALSTADDAKKSSMLNGEKVDVLSKEVTHLKSMIDSKLDDMNKEAAETIKKLQVEISALNVELERAKLVDEKLTKMDGLVEQLQMKVTNARKATLEECEQIVELKEVVASTETKLMETNESEQFATESLEITMKKMEECTNLLQDAEVGIAALKGTVEPLEIEVSKYKLDIRGSDSKLDLSEQEGLSLGETVEVLKSKIRKLEDVKLETLDKDKVAASDVERLLEEKHRLIDELELSKDEEQNAKRAMEVLASASDEMSTEVRENQERLLAKQAEIEDAQTEIEQLHSALKNTKEKYEGMLIEAKNEIDCLKKTVENFKTETSNSSIEWDSKDLDLVNAAKKKEDKDELAFLKTELAKVVDSLEAAEKEVQEAKADRNDMLDQLKQTQSATASSFQAAEEAKAELLQLKERLMEKENELQNITREKDDLQIRETDYLQKIKELHALLEEVKTQKTDEKAELSKSEKESDLLPVVSQDTSIDERTPHHHPDAEKPNENRKEIVNDGEEDSTGRMTRALASEKDLEDDSGDETELKVDGGSFEKPDNMTESPDHAVISSVKNPHQKKKPLLHKFGNLLKMGNHKSHK